MKWRVKARLVFADDLKILIFAGDEDFGCIDRDGAAEGVRGVRARAGGGRGLPLPALPRRYARQAHPRCGRVRLALAARGTGGTGGELAAVFPHSSPLRADTKGKYNNRPDLIEGLARIYAEMLVAERALEGVDMLMPVGMHWFKRMRRGYNQAEVIARTVGGMAGIEVGRAVRARRWHGPQARNTATARMENVRGMFAPVDAQSLAGLHVAIVDDILTTGATMSEAIRAVMPGMPKAISVLTLAITNN